MLTTSIKTYTIRWVIWSGLVRSLGSQPLRLIGNLLLTRLLFPDAFGAMAVVSGLINILSTLFNLGLGSSIIQNRLGDDFDALNTVWTTEIVMGFVAWISCFALAQPVANYYNDSKFLWLLPLVGFQLAIAGFNSTGLVTLSRHLEFRKLALFELSIQAIGIVVTLTVAWLYRTIWALIAGTVVMAICKMVGSHRLVPAIRNRLFWRKSIFLDLFAFGKWILLAEIFTSLFGVVEPYLFTTSNYGIFQFANNFTGVLMLGLLTIVPSFGYELIFPFFSKQADASRENLQTQVKRIRWFLLIPGMVLISLGVGTADVLIRLLYEDRFYSSIWMVQILILGVWATILAETANPVLYAISSPHYNAFGKIFQLTVIAIAILLGISGKPVVQSLVIVVLGEIFYYGVITYGLKRERLNLIQQDLKATAMLIGLLTIVLLGRRLLGFGLPV